MAMDAATQDKKELLQTNSKTKPVEIEGIHRKRKVALLKPSKTPSREAPTEASLQKARGGSKRINEKNVSSLRRAAYTQIQAATLIKPGTSTDDATKLLTEKLSHSILEHREELLEALKGIDSTGDGTDEQILPALLVPLITAIAWWRCVRSCRSRCGDSSSEGLNVSSMASCSAQ
ncbi:hypothetical protein MTO96_038361 [Rhipicephalus appendiculatus]